jgi:hypothetical protein
MSTTEVAGRTMPVPETDSHGQIVRVDLRYLLTRARPFTRSYLRVYSDEVAVPDAGFMLSQRLRLIEGVESVTITHYGCRVEIGSLYDAREMTKQIRWAVEFTLATRVPWTVHRATNNANWSFRFASPLLVKSSCMPHVDISKDLNLQLVSEFGWETFTGLSAPMAVPGSYYPYHLFMDFAGEEPEDKGWPALDWLYHGLLTEVCGRRDLTVDWE